MHHDPLTCVDLPLDQEKIDNAHDAAIAWLVRRLTFYFGHVQVRAALSEGLESSLGESLRSLTHDVTDVIASAYTMKVLADVRTARETMFEALAGGALIAHRAASSGKDTGDVARAFAVIAACERRPAVLTIAEEEDGTRECE